MNHETKRDQWRSEKISCAVKERGIRAFKAMTAWINRHRILTVLFVLMLLAVIAAACVLPKVIKAKNRQGTAEQNYEFIRTVTLSKGDLSEVVSTTGTVDSGLTSTVSYTSISNARSKR